MKSLFDLTRIRVEIFKETVILKETQGDQLLEKCYYCRTKTVDLANDELDPLGQGRDSKAVDPDEDLEDTVEEDG
jgi:hypothetical protein